MNERKKILFICHGNICRSPMAEFVMQHLVRQSQLAEHYQIASAATSWEQIGNPIYPPAAAKLKEQGITFSRTRQAQPLKLSDYAEYDLLVCMDGENVFNANRFFSGDPDAKIHLLLDYTNTPGREVADPWYSGDFEAAYRDIMAGCQGLLCFLEGWETLPEPEPAEPLPKPQARSLPRWARYRIK